jgi:hypothetical protein
MKADVRTDTGSADPEGSTEGRLKVPMKRPKRGRFLWALKTDCSLQIESWDERIVWKALSIIALASFACHISR